MKLLTGIVAATLTSVVALASANAADMYVPGPAGGYKDGPAYAEVNWSGFYLGANIGGAWATDKVTDVGGDWSGGVPKSFNNDPSGFFGGGQLGYNFQMGHFVFGPEVDLGYMDLSQKVWEPGAVGDASSTLGGGFYADVTGRLGYAVDRALVYAKGGYAYYGGSVKNWTADTPTIPGSPTTTGVSGWTVGAGLEYKISPAWSVKAEYLHFDFGSITNIAPNDLSDPCNPCKYRNELTVDTVKVGVNYFVSPAYLPLK